jgi:Mce-associated membrane protein
MAGNSESPDKPRRPVVGSRNPTRRPRKIPTQAHPEPVVETEPPSSVEPVETPAPEAPRRTPGVGGRRTTIALVVAVVVLLLVGAAEIFYLVRDDTPTVSASRPVVTGELTHRAAVEAAARSTEEILSTSYESYDEQVAQAAAKMTDAFAAEYRQTSDGIRDQFVASKTKLQVKAVAQGVVQASPAQVQALLFLDQYVEKTEDGQPRTDYRQYRALVTVVHTDQGWLVSNIETQ